MSEGMRAKRSIVKAVEERVRSGQCLVCDAKAERRGLCMNHYQTFLRRQREQGHDAADFEVACIREGKILASGQMREIKADDPFSNVL
jgi:hypothetical protein